MQEAVVRAMKMYYFGEQSPTERKIDFSPTNRKGKKKKKKKRDRN